MHVSEARVGRAGEMRVRWRRTRLAQRRVRLRVERSERSGHARPQAAVAVAAGRRHQAAQAVGRVARAPAAAGEARRDGVQGGKCSCAAQRIAGGCGVQRARARHAGVVLRLSLGRLGAAAGRGSCGAFHCKRQRLSREKQARRSAPMGDAGPPRHARRSAAPLKRHAERPQSGSQSDDVQISSLAFAPRQCRRRTRGRRRTMTWRR